MVTGIIKDSILAAIGDEEYADFMRELKTSNALIAIDAFDEPEMIAGRKRLCPYISDIAVNIDNPIVPLVFLFDRTETAKPTATFCADNGVSLRQY